MQLIVLPESIATVPVQRLNGRARRIVGAALILALTACTGPDADGTRQSARSPPQCEVKGYPCSWAEVDVEVSRRTAALFGPALDRMYEESPTALWEWLQTVPDLAEAGLAARDSTAIWFRLEGGRRAYIFGPHRHRRAAAPPEPVGAALPDQDPLQATLASPLGSFFGRVLDADGLRPRPGRTARLHVTGRDRNQDNRVNQRDQRRALVMDPFYFEHCYQSIEDRFTTADEKRQHREAITAICEGREGPQTLGLSSDQVYAYGRRVTAELEQIPAYQGHVTLLEDKAADHRWVNSWDDYDVVHVTGHGAPDMLGFGWAWPYVEDDPLPKAPFKGAIPIISRAGKYGPQQGAWAAGPDYFREKLPDGLDRTFVFLAACASMEDVEKLELIRHLSGESSGVLGWNYLVDYDDNEFLGPRVYDLLARGWTVRQALDSLLLLGSEFLQGSSDVGQTYLETKMLAYHGADLRIFETVRLDPTGIAVGPVGDNALLNPLLAGSLDDGVDDELTIDADVMAVTEEQLSEVHVHLELDGNPVGPRLPLDPKARVGENRYRVRFTRIPLGQDLKADTDYELEAVASLPEGGESRYAVRARGTAGAWTATVSGGPYSGSYSGPSAKARTFGSFGITLRSAADARPYVWIVMSFLDGRSVGSSPLEEGEGVEVVFTPDNNLAEAMYAGETVGYGSNAFGTVDPQFPPPAILEIREMDDAVVTGAVFGEFYSTTTETGAFGHSPEQRVSVRIEFRAQVQQRGPKQ